jgi:FixJ family two-component response regulator
MKGGAVDFLEKPVDEGELLAAIRRGAGRSRALKTAHAELRELQQRYGLLTPREREVFALVAAGLLNKQIAFELRIAEKTIKVHRGRVMEKMDAASLADLVRMAQRLSVHGTFEASPSSVRVYMGLKSDAR